MLHFCKICTVNRKLGYPDGASGSKKNHLRRAQRNYLGEGLLLVRNTEHGMYLKVSAIVTGKTHQLIRQTVKQCLSTSLKKRNLGFEFSSSSESQ